MSYPGDTSLASDIQQRILTTFQQTLELASKGSRQEALLGCDFILRLDPQFGPARSLQQLVNAGRSGPQLLELLGPAPAPDPAPVSGAAPPPFEALDGLSLELPEVPPASRTAGGDLGAELERLVAARSFAEALALADRERRAISADAKLRQLTEQARSRMEAEPYVRTFLDSARQALHAGEGEEAERLLRKARSLDPTHPGIAEIETARTFYEDPARAMGSRRRGIQMDDTVDASAASPASAASETRGAGDAEPGLELPDVDFSFQTPADQELELQGETGDEGSVSAEGNDRIRQLLDEGQEAFDQGEYQSAIDAWSRIFLIDIDHQVAAQRIEQARQLKAERERQLEEIFHDGSDRFDAGDLAGAETAFRRVLGIAPGYVLAQEFLDKIEARREGAPAAPAAPAAALRGATEESPRPLAVRAAQEKMSSEILVPPEPGSERASDEDRSPFAVAAKRSAVPAPSFLLIGGLVLALLLGVGWLLLHNRARLFPNAKEKLETPAPATVDAIARAKALAAEGKTAIAVAQLRRMPPQDPQYAEAQSLISQWEALEQPAEPVPAGPTAEQKARRSALVGEAEQACQQQEFLRCRASLAAAAEISPLDAQLTQLSEHASERLKPLANEIKMFQDGDYEFLLNSLWRRREDEPANRDIKRLIIDSYYDLGVLELQRGDPGAAADRFREAVALDANDAMLARLLDFAQTYTRRNDDLLYQIFVKYVPTR